MFLMILKSHVPTKPNADTREESKQSSTQHNNTWPGDTDTAVLCTGLDFAAEKFGQLSKQKCELDRL